MLTLRGSNMALKLFNTLSRSVEEFAPLDAAGRKVGMYCCGPTVHDAAHIGNFRTFVFADLVRRYLEFKGFAVDHVMNITDVEDKIIARAQAAKASPSRLGCEFSPNPHIRAPSLAFRAFQ